MDPSRCTAAPRSALDRTARNGSIGISGDGGGAVARRVRQPLSFRGRSTSGGLHRQPRRPVRRDTPRDRLPQMSSVHVKTRAAMDAAVGRASRQRSRPTADEKAALQHSNGGVHDRAIHRERLVHPEPARDPRSCSRLPLATSRKGICRRCRGAIRRSYGLTQLIRHGIS